MTLLSAFAERGDLSDRLAGNDAYSPYPTADLRPAWESLSAPLRRALVQAAEAHVDDAWPALPVTRFMDYRRDGNRRRYEALSFARRRALAALALGECVEGKGRFIDDVLNGIWCICEESFWGVPAHVGKEEHPDQLPDVERPVFDLFAGETSGLLAWTHYLLKPQLDAVAPTFSRRIRQEAKRRILDPYLERDDFWWMGFQGTRRVNNWNPWCNSNALATALFLEDDPDRRLAVVQKALRSLDRFLVVYHPDGGCDEGTSYWGKAGGAHDPDPDRRRTAETRVGRGSLSGDIKSRRRGAARTLGAGDRSFVKESRMPSGKSARRTAG